MRASGAVKVSLVTTLSTPAQRFRTALAPVNGAKSFMSLHGA